jgi:hypothetical protein
MNKALKIGGILLLSVLLTGIVYSVLQYTATVINTAYVKGYELTLWRKDMEVAVSSFEWGDLDKGSSKSTEDVLGVAGQLYIKNTGDYDLYFAWELDPSTPLPLGITLTAKYGGSAIWPPNNYNCFESPVIHPGGLDVYPVQFVLSIGSDAVRGPVTFNILLHAGTTSAG